MPSINRFERMTIGQLYKMYQETKNDRPSRTVDSYSHDSYTELLRKISQEIRARLVKRRTYGQSKNQSKP